MAVDRGELRYKIEIQDSFTKPIQKFREELLKAKNTLEFVRDSAQSFRSVAREAGQATTTVRRFRQESTAGANEERQAQRETVQRLREIAAEQKKRLGNEKLRADILRTQRVEAERAAAAERRAAREAEAAQKRAAQATRGHTAEVQRLRQQLLGTESGVNRVAFTFRRLFGILAAFTLARQVVSGFGSLVSGAVAFNRTIEDSQVGLASLFVSAGKVTNEMGKLVTGAEAFTIAQREAAIQGQLLRQDALKTTATYQELLDAFQAAIGPGLAAGLNIDQVRQVAVNISQAAAAFGLEQNQLAEEVRSLITGTGQLRTTRLAQVISNEDIRKAREAGKLFELLTTKLQPFALAADVTQQNFSGLVARLQDAVQLSSGGAGLSFFTELKGLLGDLGDLFVNVERDAKGVIQAVTPNPQAVAALAIIFNGLQEAVASIRTGLQNVDYTQVTNALSLVAGALRGIAEISVALVQGLVKGFSDVAVLGEKLFGGIDTGVLAEAARLVGRLGVSAVAASLAFSAVLGTLRLLLGPFATLFSLGSKLYGVIKLIGPAMLSFAKAAFLPVAATGLLVLGFQQVASAILGVQVGIKDLPEIIGATVEQAAAKFLGFIDTIGTTVKVRVQQAFVEMVTEAGIAVDKIKDVFDTGLAAVGSADAAVRLVEREQAAVNARRKAAAEIAQLELQIVETRKVGEQISKDADQRAGDRIQALRNQIEKLQGDNNGVPINIDTAPAEGAIASLLAKINATLDGVIGGDVVDEQAIAAKLEALSVDIQNRLGTITGNAAAVNEKQTLNSFGNLLVNSQKYIDLLSNSVQQFANFASSAIVDAFDPTKDVDIRERFAELLQGIAKQILNMIITLLVATAIAKAFGVPLYSSNEPIPPLPSGLADGGPVGQGDGKGVVLPRPASIPNSDTVPAWLTPGEFVQTASAVRKYGMDVMAAINAGALDPLALRSLAGLGSHKSLRRSVARSGALAFADGGLVPAAGVQAAQQGVSQGQRAADDQPTIALVAGNEQSMDRLLAGGKRAMLDFIKSNAPAIDGILGRNRST